MNNCWKSAEERPSFDRLYNDLDKLMNEEEEDEDLVRRQFENHYPKINWSSSWLHFKTISRQFQDNSFKNQSRILILVTPVNILGTNMIFPYPHTQIAKKLIDTVGKYDMQKDDFPHPDQAT